MSLSVCNIDIFLFQADSINWLYEKKCSMCNTEHCTRCSRLSCDIRNFQIHLEIKQYFEKRKFSKCLQKCIGFNSVLLSHNLLIIWFPFFCISFFIMFIFFQGPGNVLPCLYCLVVLPIRTYLRAERFPIPLFVFS